MISATDQRRVDDEISAKSGGRKPHGSCQHPRPDQGEHSLLASRSLIRRRVEILAGRDDPNVPGAVVPRVPGPMTDDVIVIQFGMTGLAVHRAGQNCVEIRARRVEGHVQDRVSEIPDSERL